MALNRCLDALDFRNIHAHSNNQDASSGGKFRLYGQSDYTGRILAPTKTVRRKPRPRKLRTASAATKGWREHVSQGLRILQVPAFARVPWLIHGFSTRPGGVSDLDGEKILNLGFAEWDTSENVHENRRRFHTALSAGESKLIPLKQIHSDIVHSFEIPPDVPRRGDASATNRPGLLLSVQTADCVPVLLVDFKKRAVAAVHAGWRGTLRRIVTKAIGKMTMQFGTRPDDLIAALGPSIGGCCYQVGPEVAVEYQSQFPNASQWFDELRTGEEPNPLQWLNMMPPGHQPPPKSVLLDLRKANRAQLLESGVPPRNIHVSDLCTACRCDLLFSYRKEGAMAGRLMAVIGIRNI
jgi:YfiH family protein